MQSEALKRYYSCTNQTNPFHNTTSTIVNNLPHDDIDKMLAKPSWSVKSLQDTQEATRPTESITQKQLHHLLRLSALPLPTSAEEEAKMIHTLESQLQFVQAIQKIDTTGVEPLQSIRDETLQAEAENEITLESMKEELEKEETVGFSRRIQRKKSALVQQNEQKWDPLSLTPNVRGRYIVVDNKRN